MPIICFFLSFFIPQLKSFLVAVKVDMVYRPKPFSYPPVELSQAGKRKEVMETAVAPGIFKA
jgi:hypothetical protein